MSTITKTSTARKRAVAPRAAASLSDKPKALRTGKAQAETEPVERADTDGAARDQPQPEATIAEDGAKLPASEPKGKLGTLIGLMGAGDGATLNAMMDATGWQAHSVRGAIAGSLKKKTGLKIVSEKIDGVRRYRIVGSASGGEASPPQEPAALSEGRAHNADVETA